MTIHLRSIALTMNLILIVGGLHDALLGETKAEWWRGVFLLYGALISLTICRYAELEEEHMKKL